MLFFTTLMMAATVAALPTKISLTHKGRAAATVYTQCSKPNVVALTYDDGPYTWNSDIVNTLDAHNAKGTFFLNGNNYQCIYSPTNVAQIRKAYASGHQIASHTWSHLDLTTLDSSTLASELDRANEAITKITGAFPAMMRPPFGSTNAEVLEAIGARGQSVALWSFDSKDADGASAATVQASYDSLASSHPSSIVALNHETYEHSAHATLDHALQVLGAAGYSFVTMAECVGTNPYVTTGGPQSSDGSC